MIGPAAIEIAELAPQIPMAELSFSAGKTERSSASVFGISSAPNTPCSARHTMTSPMLPDRPTSSDVTANPAMPTRKTFFRPNRSPSLPPTIRSTASASR
ncbi:hypothetical protein FrEUN1fDRAFT_5510 [Parafrankia sp. EUN1f]|nr:hypothetical protein FrEUN1fDRAFT_5510 [Parafrankia sp. EUN1f]